MGGRESSGAGGRLAQRHEAASFSTLSHSHYSTYLDCCQEKYATQGGYDSSRRKGRGAGGLFVVSAFADLTIEVSLTRDLNLG